MNQYGFYSQQHYENYGGYRYLSPGGNEVVVTYVDDASNPQEFAYIFGEYKRRFPDVIIQGIVTRFLGRDPVSRSYEGRNVFYFNY